MSELKGSLLGVLLVLILFGTMSACLTAAFNTMTSKTTEQVTSIVEDVK